MNARLVTEPEQGSLDRILRFSRSANILCSGSIAKLLMCWAGSRESCHKDTKTRSHTKNFVQLCDLVPLWRVARGRNTRFTKKLQNFTPPNRCAIFQPAFHTFFIKEDL